MKIDNQTVLEAKWARQAQDMLHKAEETPRGPKREALARKVRQLETASEMERWLSSKELLPPR